MKFERKLQFNIRDIYVYLVKLVLFVTIIISGTTFINSLVDYLIPTDYIDNFETYKNNYLTNSSNNYNSDEMKSMYDDYVEREKDVQSSYKLNNLTSSLIILFICFIVLFFLRSSSSNSFASLHSSHEDDLDKDKSNK